MLFCYIFICRILEIQGVNNSEVMGHFGPIPVPILGCFGPISVQSGRLGPISGVGHFGPILVGCFGPIFIQF